MADLAIQRGSVTGAVVTMAAASGGGDTMPSGASLLVRNADASSKTVTIAVPGSKYGQARPDFSLAVPAGAIARFGPFPHDLADPADGKVHITYSAVTSVTVAAIS